MVDIRVHVDSVVTKLGKLTGKEAKAVLVKMFVAIGATHSNTVKTKRFDEYRGRSYRRKLQDRRGNLRKSIGYKVEKNMAGLNVEARMFAGSRLAPYARLQEEGGVVRPRKRQYLTIPLPPVLTPGGALSGKYKIRFGGVSRAVRRGRVKYQTDAGPTFIFKSKKGNLIVGITNPKTGKPFMMAGGKRPKAFYVLKKQVTVPGRLGFVKTWKRATRRYIAKRMDRASEELVNL